ncbi:MAG TPA: DUF3108 domain-containing protein [Burkholderiaceae bacterium]|nr:DUF3108 domain-containing protein [Burkholderiaceae bacterium]
MAGTLKSHSPLKRPLGIALLAAVTLAHLWLSDELMEDRLGFGAQRDTMRRIEVAYVRELAVAPPPVAAPPRPRPRPRRAAVAKAPPASAPASSVLDGAIVETVEPIPPPMPAARPPVPVAELPAPAAEVPSPVATASQPAPAEASAASAPAAVVAGAASAPVAAAPAFDWPPSTRLTYVMHGNYRGEVQGSATVEWIRAGLHYQVHMEAIVGPSFAPILVRRASSDGELGDHGLAPRRFEGEQRVAFKSRRWAMSFEPDRVRLPEGREGPALPGVQDEASLFVQLTWLFTTQPQMLQPGRSIEVPLALPRRVEVWQYDVIGQETLRLPFGELSTMHVKPRRLARPSTDLTTQMWFAPGLQYLPVRILVEQGADSFIDLQLERAPQQAADR